MYLNNSRINITDKKISELEDKAIKLSKIKHKEKGK